MATPFRKRLTIDAELTKDLELVEFLKEILGATKATLDKSDRNKSHETLCSLHSLFFTKLTARTKSTDNDLIEYQVGNGICEHGNGWDCTNSIAGTTTYCQKHLDEYENEKIHWRSNA